LALVIIGVVSLLNATFIGVAISSLSGCVLLSMQNQGWRRGVALVSALVCLILMKLILEDYALDAAWVARDVNHLLTLSGGLLILAFAAKYCFKNPKYQQYSSLCSVAVIFLSVCLLQFRYNGPAMPHTIQKLDDYFAAAKVVSQHSTEEEPIITAPLVDMPMLEVSADRASILQILKAHVAYFAPTLVTNFDLALRDFGIDIRTYNGNWVDLMQEAPQIWKTQLTNEHVSYLSKKYRSTVLLTYEDHSLRFPTLYAGKYFKVYNIDQTFISSELNDP